MMENLSAFEIEILARIPKGFYYMARDASQELYVYEHYPRKEFGREEIWTHDCGVAKLLFLTDIFCDIRWEDAAPWQFR